MTAPAFQTGDVVRLGSGGPLVTVASMTVDRQYVNVTWISDHGAHHAQLRAGMLVLVRRDPKPRKR